MWHILFRCVKSSPKNLPEGYFCIQQGYRFKLFFFQNLSLCDCCFSNSALLALKKIKKILPVCCTFLTSYMFPLFALFISVYEGNFTFCLFTKSSFHESILTCWVCLQWRPLRGECLLKKWGNDDSGSCLVYREDVESSDSVDFSW